MNRTPSTLWSLLRAALLSSTALSACTPSTGSDTQAPPSKEPSAQTNTPKTSAPKTDETKPTTIEARAKELLTSAWSHEPKVTALLKSLSAAHGGRMVGLEYRLKTEGSTIRKLKKIHAEQPETSVSDLSINDALRYTIEASDEPKGKHIKVIQAVLKRLEAEGFRVQTVKNYWPRGDNYSGVNTVLATADGFTWELQFHTPESVLESRQSHKLYEELRAQDTSLKRKLELFKQMSAPWEKLPIPESILEEKNLHAQEVIKSLPAPSKP